MSKSAKSENRIDGKIGELIREYRLKAKMSQKEIADKLGYTQSVFVSLIENGSSKVPLQTLGELINILGIPEKKITKILVESYAERVKAELFEGKKKSAG
ncbi:MAG: helix-turn-helix domain-containing protein [Proteobacteria bacterium]|jgi:transcriptional regulator with XRE-family HTH domain|nr:helix-turn-helix domain-containing protein [Pseudomonadota bacterium]